jgi:hypothetical protein
MNECGRRREQRERYGQNCGPLDEIMISSFGVESQRSHLLTAAFHRDCFMVEAAHAPRLKALSSARNRVSNRIASMCSFLYRTFSPDPQYWALDRPLLIE